MILNVNVSFEKASNGFREREYSALTFEFTLLSDSEMRLRYASSDSVFLGDTVSAGGASADVYEGRLTRSR